MIPPDIVAELRGLQDDVTPFSYEEVRPHVKQAELELTIEQAFLTFDERPIAAASIGQVHRATLPTGDEVVVKVQRPEAPRQVESDPAARRPSAARVASVSACARSTSSTPRPSSTSSPGRSAKEARLQPRGPQCRDVPPQTSATRTRSWCRRSSGATRARGCSRSSTSRARSSPTSTSSRGLRRSVASSHTG